MNKKIIALAVAVAFSAPAVADTANVTVYGTAHLSLDSNGGNTGSDLVGTKNGLNLTTGASNLGFKGTEELGGGLKAVYQYETEVNTQGSTGLFATQRDTYVGVAGGFGTVIAGRLPLANQYVGDANFFGSKVGDNGNFTAGGFGGLNLLAVPSRVNRAVAYVSPSLGGATVTAAFVPNTAQSIVSTTPQANLGKASSFTLRAAYDNNGFFGAVNYLNLGVAGIGLTATPTAGVPGAAGIAQDGAKLNILSLAGGYDFGVAKIRAQVVKTKANQQAGFSAGVNGKVAQNVYTIGGQFNLGETDSIKLELTNARDVQFGSATQKTTHGTLFAIGYDHNLSKRTILYGAYAKAFNGLNARFSATNYAHGGVGEPGLGKDPSAFSVGVIHKF